MELISDVEFSSPHFQANGEWGNYEPRKGYWIVQIAVPLQEEEEEAEELGERTTGLNYTARWVLQLQKLTVLECKKTAGRKKNYTLGLEL